MLEHYEAVIGLEVHVELKTGRKIFCTCPASFGASPNTFCCPICMGFPGTLPVLNRTALLLGVKAGLATGCEISREVRFHRKHYTYPDLPKAYQITQYDLPLCSGGGLTFTCESGEKTVEITFDEKPQQTEDTTPTQEVPQPNEGSYDEWFDYFRRYFGG